MESSRVTSARTPFLHCPTLPRPSATCDHRLWSLGSPCGFSQATDSLTRSLKHPQRPVKSVQDTLDRGLTVWFYPMRVYRPAGRMRPNTQCRVRAARLHPVKMHGKTHGEASDRQSGEVEVHRLPACGSAQGARSCRLRLTRHRGPAWFVVGAVELGGTGQRTIAKSSLTGMSRCPACFISKLRGVYVRSCPRPCSSTCRRAWLSTHRQRGPPTHFVQSVFI